jgi:hypothetical protein
MATALIQSFVMASRPSRTKADCSVFQGCVLGPVGFKAYIENIPYVFVEPEGRSHWNVDDKRLLRQLPAIELRRRRAAFFTMSS